ncbi:MAG: 1-acyl-sn-glycerol-3-phosphate acyltransferase [Chlamydiia bacterium]
MISFTQKLHRYTDQGLIPEKYKRILQDFYRCYLCTLERNKIDPSPYESIFTTYLDLVKEQIAAPFAFEPYHHQIVQPFDYYQYGLDFMRPLVDITRSSVGGHAALKNMEAALQRKENIILLANHQIEADPQAISLLIEKEFPQLAQEMIFVAGERVLTDPLAIPFSLGRNLLCIYSKKHIDHPPELKTHKQMHNKKTMELMSSLLSEGGKCIYVAPSGGRDRQGLSGLVEVASFDGQSIEMFYLMAKKSKTPTTFYPLSLATYGLLPPPETTQVELGELRKTERVGIHAHFGDPIDMDHFPGSTLSDKHARRQERADYICSLVKQAYSQFPTSGATS